MKKFTKEDILNSAPVMIAVHDKDYNLVWVNAAYCERAGRSLSELKGKKCFHLWNFTEPCPNCPAARVIETGREEELEISPKGCGLDDQRYWLSRSGPIRDEHGEIIGTVEAKYEITARVEAREKSAAAIQQLDAANQQLEATNQELDATNQQLKANNQQLRAKEQQLLATNQQLSIRESDLRERVKEINCLYKIAQLLDQSIVEGSDDDLLKEVVETIADSWQYPEMTSVRLELGGERYETRDFVETKWRQREEIFAGDKKAEGLKGTDNVVLGGVVSSKALSREAHVSSPRGVKLIAERIGALEVFYTGEWDDAEGEPFLREEYDLVHNIARELGHWVERRKYREELERSRAMLARTEEISHIGSWEWDIEKDEVKWSRELYEIFQLDSSLPPPSYAEHPTIYPKEDMNKLHEAVEAAISNGTPYELELNGLRPDGSTRLCHVQGYAEKEEGKPVTKLYGSFQDITEQKAAQEALLKSEEKFRLLANNTVDCIWRLSLDGVFEYINPACEVLLGYSQEEILGTALSNYCSEENFALMTDEIATALSHLEDFEKKFLATQMIKRDGSTVEVEITAKILLGENGEPVAIQGVTRDVTEKRASEKEMARLMSAVEQSGEIFVITDTHGTMLYVNPAFQRVTGYSREEVIGKNPRILKSGKQDAGFYRELWSKISRGEPWRGRMVNKRRDGSFYTEEGVISPVRDEAGEIVNYVAVTRDITEELKVSAMLEQSQKLESVGRLAGGIAHDYNNMLSVILGYAEFAISSTDLNDQVRSDIEEIMNAAKRSSRITEQLLAFARKQTIAPEVLNLNETMESMLRMLHQLIGEDITIVWVPFGGIWPVKVDPSQIDQILANLCVNAKDSIDGVGKIIIETENVEIDEQYGADCLVAIPGDYVKLSISDSGAGMTAEIKEMIFEPFFTTKEIHTGTGLGLATVYGIVKQNNGFINVYSEPGEGSTFKIYLPRYLGVTDEKREEEDEKAISGSGETILFVEDEPALRVMGETMLNGLGYNAIAAGSPNEAISFAKEHKGGIDLLITDIVMPEMNGNELACHLKGLLPSLKILFMSGYTANVIVHHGVLDRGVNFMQKPFSRTQLSRKVRKILDSQYTGEDSSQDSS